MEEEAAKPDDPTRNRKDSAMKKVTVTVATLMLAAVPAIAQTSTPDTSQPAAQPAAASAPAPAPAPAPTGPSPAQAAALAALAPVVPPTPRDPELSIFGIGSSSMRDGNHPQWMPQMAAIGIRDCRAMYGSWGIEKTEGQFDFTNFDARLAYDESVGVQDGVVFNGTPPWKKGLERGLPMHSLPEWSDMVKAMVTHTKGRIKLFECWNEPPNGTDKSQTPADYAQVLCATYDAAKAANPDAMVGMAAKSVDLNYLDQALVGGAKGHYDYITLHPYEVLGSVISHPGTEQVYLSIVPNIRKMLAARDPDKVNVPVILTEIGIDIRRGLDKQAQAVLKTYIMGIHQGIACINYYEGMDGDSGPLGLLDGRGTTRPAYDALGRLIATVGRHPTSLGWVMLNVKHYGFMIQGDKGPVLATWTSTTAPDDVDFGQDVDVLDPMTGTTTKASKVNLTLSPVLILNVPDNLVAQAKANKGQPMPWGGDYSKAKSVSVSFTDKYVEKGLHTMAADSIAADVLAYGGNARAGEVPKGGNVFLVDPNFLSYDTVPIEITALVRRDDKNEPASLNLEYESTSGYKKPPPFVIPDNNPDPTQWTTATWKIDDCQFVGNWAFHFRFNTGKFLVQSVTVTRLDR